MIAAEVDNPAVVRANVRRGEFGVLYPAFPENPNRWVQQSNINLLLIHLFSMLRRAAVNGIGRPGDK